MMLDIITNSPFRILGVFSNASAKDIVANVSKIRAYLKVGKGVSFEADLTSILPQIIRTNETVDHAQSMINLPNDRLVNGLFWFFKDGTIDEIAIGHLVVGNIQKAKDIFDKKTTYSSLLNRGILALIENDIKKAISSYLLLIENENYRESFVEKVCGGDRIKNSKELLTSGFFDTLLSSYSPIDLLEELDSNSEGDAVAYVKNKAVSSFINTINSEILVAKSADKASSSQYNAAVKLIRNTKEPFGVLKSLSPEEDVFKIVADNLAKQILQNAINYYNNSDEYNKAKKAFKLQNYALSIAEGKLTKERCQENVNILLKAIESLPPETLLQEDLAIQNRLRSFNQSRSDKAFCRDLGNVVSFIEDCAPYLAAIKEVQGGDGLYYRRTSSLIEETALSVTISVVNEALRSIKEGDPATKYYALAALKRTLEKAWRATKYMEALDLTPESESRLSTQKASLSHLMDQASVHKDNRIEFKLETDSEIYNQCKTKQDLQKYLQRLPNGKHVAEAKQRIIAFENQEKTVRQQLLNEIDGVTSLQQAISLKPRCKETALLKKLDDKCFSLCKSKTDYKNYLKVFGYNAYHKIEANSHLKFDNWLSSVTNKIKENKGWAIAIAIALVLVVVVGLIWGPIGYSRMLYVLAVLFGLTAYGALSDKSGSSGCGLILICAAIAAVCGFGGYAIDEAQKAKEKNAAAEVAFRQLGKNPSEKECASFVSKYPNSPRYDEVMGLYFRVASKNGPKSLSEFANKYRYNDWGKKASKRVASMCDSLYLLASSAGTIDAWRSYRSNVPAEYFKDSNSRIEEIENQAWNTEAKAWKQASSSNTLASYQKYLELYPNGAHKATADKKIIDLQVASVFSGEHGQLPSMDRTGYGGGSSSRIEVYNNTAYTLTLLYSGPDSKRLVIPSRQTSSITLRNGSYSIAASVSAAGVRSFAGRESLNGGEYSVEYYIVTSRY